MDCDASIYGEVVIFITEKAKRCFLNGGPMWASNAKDEFNANMLTEW